MFKRGAFIAASLCLAPSLCAKEPKADNLFSDIDKFSAKLQLAWDNLLLRHKWISPLEDRYNIEMRGQSFAGMTINGNSAGQFFILQRDFKPERFYDQSYDLHYSRTQNGFGLWGGANWQEHRAVELMPLVGLSYRSGNSYLSLDQTGNFTFMQGNGNKRFMLEAGKKRLGASLLLRF